MPPPQGANSIIGTDPDAILLSPQITYTPHTIIHCRFHLDIISLTHPLRSHKTLFKHLLPISAGCIRYVPPALTQANPTAHRTCRCGSKAPATVPIRGLHQTRNKKSVPHEIVQSHGLYRHGLHAQTKHDYTGCPNKAMQIRNAGSFANLDPFPPRDVPKLSPTVGRSH